MEISYLSVYKKGSRPQAVKRISDGSGDFVDTPVSFEFTAEVENFTVEAIYQHLNNLVEYIKNTSQKLTPIGLEDEIPSDGWHLAGGWGEMMWANEECLKWWSHVYYKDEPELTLSLPGEYAIFPEE
jgi:hypothetical protein